MLQVIYASAATNAMPPEELQEILRKARVHNAAQGVSGILVYHDGSFLQVLEGPKAAVTALVRRIKADPRHTRFRLLSRERTKSREFGDWSMEFIDASGEAEALDGFLAYDGGAGDAAGGARARRVLEQFRDGGWRQAEAFQEVVTRR